MTEPVEDGKMSRGDREREQLQERAKELDCLYRVEEELERDEAETDEVLQAVAERLPAGWQYPESCHALIIYRDRVYRDPGYQRTAWTLSTPLFLFGDRVGKVTVSYDREHPAADEGPFLKEERRLLEAIAGRVGNFLMQRCLATLPGRSTPDGTTGDGDLHSVLEFLRRTDNKLLVRITRKMINYLAWSGVGETEELFRRFAGEQDEGGRVGDENRPSPKRSLADLQEFSDRVFRLAADHMSTEQVISCIQQWLKEEKVSFLKVVLEDQNASLSDVAEALDRYAHMEIREEKLPLAARRALRVSLIRRFLTTQLDFINVAKQYLRIQDFSGLLARMIVLPKSHGQLGGKAAGLFLAANVLRRLGEQREQLAEVKTPKSWYIPSDGIMAFINYNDLEDLHNQKYLDIEQVRQEYHHIIQVFKNSYFPPEMVRGLAAALDDLGERPLIVRSSSLLEDRSGAVFSGKYKSLFLANQGDRESRLAALMDAVAEVYASLFSPDSIEYRTERGLLDVHEEMGVLIQEVVGTRVGNYFLPAFAGVAFSYNEFRWSPRIDREDGLVRLVPGLGTRAVDRMADDYPVLLAPGQPELRANVTADEVARYSPRFIDLINLEDGGFETMPLEQVLRRVGGRLPGAKKMISRLEGDRITQPLPFAIDWAQDDLVCTFGGMGGRSPFVQRMQLILKVLKERLGYPVDIEFAHDGKDFYLLQCRPQSFGPESKAAPIPRDIPEERILFNARRYVSNGTVPDITHLVYIDPAAYGGIESLERLRAVGRAVGRLNRLLPKRRFVLMGPGRWGSRGDIKLGVSVTYSDINNTACLIEVGRQKKDYCPDLSFGTHFFQDLVEASIRYLPLYPDDPGIRFNEDFLLGAPNVLAEIDPELAPLADVVRVIDVPAAADGQILKILLNADLDEALGYLASPGPPQRTGDGEQVVTGTAVSTEHWRWRLGVAQRVAAELEGERFGVKALYLFGSTKNANAGPGSDIDLLVHFRGSETQRRELLLWFEGWSLCLGEMNYLRTGVRTEGLLDVHLVTDRDLERQESYAAKIDAVTDAARPLRIYGE